MQTEELLEAWNRHHRINIYVLDNIHESHLLDRWDVDSPHVGMQFAQLHGIRRMWLQVGAADLWEQTKEIDRKKVNYKAYLREQLNESALAMSTFLQQGLEQNKIKGFKAGPINFLAYLISLESHHRSEILSTLKSQGREISEDLEFGMWDWTKR